MKLTVNLNVAVQVVTLSEGAALAEKGGIARQTAVDVLTESAVASPALRFRAPFLLGLPEHAWFDVEMQKDLRLGLDADELAVPLPTTAVANELLTPARAIGLGPEDFAALFHVVARAGALEP